MAKTTYTSGIRRAVISALVMLVACAGSPEPETPAEPAVDPASDYVACEDPRPQMCTREYMPVCAERDTGIRCVTTPCDSTEWVTRSTGCTACSDPEILGYRPNACPDSE